MARADSAQRERARKAKIRLRLRWKYMVEWEPDIDYVTGEGGDGLLAGLRIWWQVRTGRWRDDDLDDLWDDEPRSYATPRSPFGA